MIQVLSSFWDRSTLASRSCAPGSARFPQKAAGSPAPWRSGCRPARRIGSGCCNRICLRSSGAGIPGLFDFEAKARPTEQQGRSNECCPYSSPGGDRAIHRKARIGTQPRSKGEGTQGAEAVAIRAGAVGLVEREQRG